jgi:catalase
MSERQRSSDLNYGGSHHVTLKSRSQNPSTSPSPEATMTHTAFNRRTLYNSIVTAASVLGILAPVRSPAQNMTPSAASPLDLVNGLHTAFGEHHARAVHTKGVMLDGSFTPSPGARDLTMEPIFEGGTLPVVARFSIFAGVPDLADNDDGASPAGFAVKIKEKAETDFDIVTNQHPDFIAATSDDFLAFLRAAGPAGKGDKAPMDAFLSSHPHAKQFLGSLTYPVSYAQATYYGINTVKFTNSKGGAAFVRYRLVPHAEARYLTPEERKARGPTYLQDEIANRIAREPVAFDWFAQIARPGDKIEDPSIAWPESRRMVKLGTVTLNKLVADGEASQRTLVFLPGQPHLGVEPADPMLVLRNTAYPISLGQRQ